MLQIEKAYRRGWVGSPDQAIADQWLRRAFDAGSERAQLKLAKQLWSQGQSEEAQAVLSVGVRAGWAPALYMLSTYKLVVDPSRATWRAIRPLLEQAASKGSLSAEHTLAHGMLFGKYGFHNIAKGIGLARKTLKRRMALLNKALAESEHA